MSNLVNHWQSYVNAIGGTTKPTSTTSITQPFQTTSSKIGVSGFLDLTPKPSDAQFQARYDAMSGSWEGVSASEKAVLKSKTDKTEFMPYSAR
jgi:hypothetical protein